MLVDGLVTRTGRRVTRPLDAQIDSGSAVQLRGPNGAGKTTFLAVLSGRLPVISGSVALGNAALPAVRSMGRVVVFGADLQPPPRLSFVKWARSRAGFYGIDTGRLDASCERWGVDAYANRPMTQLSTGMRWRCVLAFAFADHIGGVVALDEPERSLDVAGLELLNRAIVEHSRSGGICIVASHDLGGHLSAIDAEVQIRWCQ
jgi:ABC-type multidrug transport system ATPase subunit